MSRSWESAMPMALRYSSLERKCVSRERARSAVALEDREGTKATPGLFRAVT
jgi:hypothetical protein